MEQNYVYVVFSATPYKIGKMIRTLTREPYNHISIALDEDLKQMYAFARRYRNTPFYGGFVKETASRYSPNGMRSRIKVHRIPISPQAYEDLSKRIEGMYANREAYLYNHLSFLAVPLKKPIPIRDAYTCLEFCVDVLHNAGFDVTPEKFYSIGDMLSLLESYAVYEGELAYTGNFDAEYYAQKPIPHPTSTSVKGIWDLVPRIKWI